MAKAGYQAVDIGQLDNEYDWYIRGVKERVTIEGKMVAEMMDNSTIENFYDERYISQIAAEIK